MTEFISPAEVVTDDRNLLDPDVVDPDELVVDDDDHPTNDDKLDENEEVADDIS